MAAHLVYVHPRKQGLVAFHGQSERALPRRRRPHVRAGGQSPPSSRQLPSAAGTRIRRDVKSTMTPVSRAQDLAAQVAPHGRHDVACAFRVLQELCAHTSLNAEVFRAAHIDIYGLNVATDDLCRFHCVATLCSAELQYHTLPLFAACSKYGLVHGLLARERAGVEGRPFQKVNGLVTLCDKRAQLLITASETLLGRVGRSCVSLLGTWATDPNAEPTVYYSPALHQLLVDKLLHIHKVRSVV
eukprot:scaffold164_cov409-Prasinococcus_capsulatus_cf.AAC.9